MPVTNRRIVTEEDSAGLYPTPAWATQALLDHETIQGDIWEPACGDGSMSGVLLANGHRVLSTDLLDHGYARGLPGMDFLRAEWLPREEGGGWPNIVTNPPFPLAEEFIDRALELARNKVAMLLRLAFLEGVGRHDRLYGIPRRRPSRVWIFSERITFYRKGATTAGSGTTAYGWFVWDLATPPPPDPALKWLPPGCKARVVPWQA